MKVVLRHQTWHEPINRSATVDSRFVLLGTLQHCVVPTLPTFIVCGPFSLSFHIYVFSDRRSFQIRYATLLKRGNDLAFKCLGWPCPATFIFCFLRHKSWYFVSLRLETSDMAKSILGGNCVQSTELDVVNGSLCNLCSFALELALYLFATQCWWVQRRTKELSTVAIPLYRFLSCWVSQNVCHVVSSLQSIVCLHIFNIGEVWNPVCCHGNKTVQLALRSTYTRILMQRTKHFWFKLVEISFFFIFDQNLIK